MLNTNGRGQATLDKMLSNPQSKQRAEFWMNVKRRVYILVRVKEANLCKQRSLNTKCPLLLYTHRKQEAKKHQKSWKRIFCVRNTFCSVRSLFSNYYSLSSVLIHLRPGWTKHTETIRVFAFFLNDRQRKASKHSQEPGYYSKLKANVKKKRNFACSE